MAKIIKCKGTESISRDLIFDNELSDRARFVYCYMMAKPDNWEFFVKVMAREIGYHEDTLHKYINELIQRGWLERNGQSRNGENRWGAVSYTIYETRQEKSRDGNFPSRENPVTEKYGDGNSQAQKNIDFGESLDNKEKQKEKTTLSAIPYDVIKNAWNNKCSNITSVTTITAKRKVKIRARFNEFSEVGEPLEVYNMLLDKISKSKWLTEQSRENWRKGLFDWLFANSENWVKIWEGKYNSLSQDNYPITQSQQQRFDVYGKEINEILQ